MFRYDSKSGKYLDYYLNAFFFVPFIIYLVFIVDVNLAVRCLKSVCSSYNTMLTGIHADLNIVLPMISLRNMLQSFVSVLYVYLLTFRLRYHIAFRTI